MADRSTINCMQVGARPPFTKLSMYMYRNTPVEPKLNLISVLWVHYRMKDEWRVLDRSNARLHRYIWKPHAKEKMKIPDRIKLRSVHRVLVGILFEPVHIKLLLFSGKAHQNWMYLRREFGWLTPTPWCLHFWAECRELLLCMLKKNPEMRPTVDDILDHPWTQVDVSVRMDFSSVKQHEEPPTPPLAANGEASGRTAAAAVASRPAVAPPSRWNVAVACKSAAAAEISTAVAFGVTAAEPDFSRQACCIL